MPQPARPTPRRIQHGSSRSKPKVRLDVLLIVAATLIVVVQFSLHSSVNEIDGGVVDTDVGRADSERTGERAARVNSPKEPRQQQQQQQQQQQREEPSDFPTHYTTFSTACSASQNWQALVFFYFARRVSQPGYVVRVASGCSESQRAELEAFHRSHISKLSDRFLVHFTPDYSTVAGDSYKYFNKPFGLQHWMEYGLKYNENKEHEDAIIMILDPDMILLRPLTYDFTNSNVIIHKSQKWGEGPPVKKVMHGQPWASLYAFGDGPFRQDLGDIFANHTDSPALRVNRDEQSHNYPGGPPYMATGRDMYKIVNAWCEFVPATHLKNPSSILCEMFGWSLGAAHVQLPHVLAESFMVSNTDISQGEGWALIDALNDDQVCEYSTTKESEDKLPYTMHFCQNYWLGKWFIGKYRLNSDFLSCETPLLLEPPKNLAALYDYYIKPGGKPYGQKVRIKPSTAKREAFMICQLVSRFNDAATWYKDQTCKEGEGNYEKSWIFHHHLDPDNNEGGEKSAKW